MSGGSAGGTAGVAGAPLSLLYLDSALAVCVKLQGQDPERDLPRLLLEKTGREFRCVHRLDLPVGGVMAYAAPHAAGALSRSIAEGKLEKEYRCVCAGVPEPAAGELRDLLFRDRQRNRTYVVDRPRKGVREALLRYRTLGTAEAGGQILSLLAVEPVTGRSHQIRVQFASKGHPLAGDGRYGSRIKLPFVALWSCRLAFPHPETGERVAFSCPPPEVWPWGLFTARIVS